MTLLQLQRKYQVRKLRIILNDYHIMLDRLEEHDTDMLAQVLLRIIYVLNETIKGKIKLIGEPHYQIIMTTQMQMLKTLFSYFKTDFRGKGIDLKIDFESYEVSFNGMPPRQTLYRQSGATTSEGRPPPPAYKPVSIIICQSKMD